jgi:hypothetical protein
MKFLSAGDKAARERAEQRGDTITARSDSTFTQANALMYFEFAGSPKSKDKVAQMKKKMEASSRALEKSGEKVKGAFAEQSQAEQKQVRQKESGSRKRTRILAMAPGFPRRSLSLERRVHLGYPVFGTMEIMPFVSRIAYLIWSIRSKPCFSRAAARISRSSTRARCMSSFNGRP